MGLITAVLSYVIKIHKLVIGLRQKDTNPSYNADTDSNEAIREKVDINRTAISGIETDIAGLNDISSAEVLQQAKGALNTTIPDTGIYGNSVWHILDDQLKPRLPGSGTLSTLTTSDVVNSTEATTAAKDALNYPIPANNNGSVWDILKDQLSPRLPSTGTITTTDDVDTTELNQELDQRKTAKGIQGQTSSTSWTDIINITDKGVLTGIFQYFEYEGTHTNYIYAGIQIIIDGQTILTSDRFSTYKITSNPATRIVISGSLAFNHRFNTSLRIKHKTNYYDAPVYTNISYTTD